MDDKIIFLDVNVIANGKYFRGNLVKMKRKRNFAAAKCQRTRLFDDKLFKKGIQLKHLVYGRKIGSERTCRGGGSLFR